MKFPIFASFLVFCAFVTFITKKSSKQGRQTREEFFEKERQANATRRQPLDTLEYITIPLASLPLECCKDDEKIKEYIEIISTLSQNKIVNLTGITNTDLKLKYGAPNIDLLMNFDQNFTVLVRTLHLWGKRLEELEEKEAAIKVLEFGVQCQSDVSGNYQILGAIYKEQGKDYKIQELLDTAKSLNSMTKNSIVRYLENLL